MDSLIIFLAKDLIIAVVITLAVTWIMLNHRKKEELILAILAGGIMALIISKITGALYYHPRPFVVQHTVPLVSHGADNGFPSEHTVLAMTLTSLIYYYRRSLAILAFGLSLLVGAGRVWAHVHSPLDIAGGVVIGAISGYIGYKLANRFWRKPKPNATTKKKVD